MEKKIILKTRRYIFSLAVIFCCLLVLNACIDPINNKPEIPPEPEKPAETEVEFKNLEQYPVTIYRDNDRKIFFTEIAANSTTKVTAEPAPMANNAFFITYHLTYPIETKGVITIPYGNEHNFIVFAIEANKVNDAPIPKLETIEIDSAYIMLVNESEFSLLLREDIREKHPIDGRTTIINSGLNASYEIIPGSANNYSLFRNQSTPVLFPEELNKFKPAIIYVLTYDGTALKVTNEISLLQTIPPTTPENVRAEVLSSSSVRISWDEVYGALEYKIYRAEGSEIAPYNLIYTTPLIPYIDTELSAGQTYYYKVRAISSATQESLQSIPVSANMSPENLRATNITTISISLAWNIFDGANSYNIYRSSDEDGIYTKINTNAIIENNFTDTDVTPDTTYFYKVNKIINGIDGIQSSPISVNSMSSIPTNVRTTSVSNISINIAWNIVIGANGYNVYRSDNGIYHKINTEMVIGNEFTDINILPDTTYNYKISSINRGIEGLLSASVSTVTLLSEPDPKGTSYSSVSVNLSWEPVNGAEYYKVYYSTGNSFNTANQFSQTSATTETVTGLNANTPYYFWVTAHNNINYSQQSPEVAVTTLLLSPLPKITSRLNDRIGLSWQQVNGADSYKIYYSTVNSFETAIKYSPGQTITNLNCVVPSLDTNTAYYFWVKAFNNDGNKSLPSEPVMGMTLLSNPEPKITNYSNVSVSLSWEPVDGAEYYKVYYSIDNSFDTANPFPQISTTAKTVTGLNAGTPYYFWVTAHNNINRSLQSPVAEATTVLLSPLLEVTSRLSDRIGLSWDKVDGAEYYRVYYNTNDSFEIERILVETSTTGHTVTRLSPGTHYYFWVTAHNKNTSSVHSPTAEASTVTSLIKFDFTNPSDPVLRGEHEEEIEETIIITRINRTGYTVRVDIDGWDNNPQWYLNGVFQPQSSDNTFTIDWMSPIGSYVLSVVVTKNGVPYSASIRFRVE